VELARSRSCIQYAAGVQLASWGRDI
jgi:hypothetical protein